MRKRAISFMLVFLLIVSMFASSAMVFAADVSNGVSTSKNGVLPGETFVVTLKVPPISDLLSSVGFKIKFEKTAFEMIEYSPADIIGQETKSFSALADANAVGSFTVSYIGVSGDNTLNLTSGYELSAKFKVLETATTGIREFEITEYTTASWDDTISGYVDHKPAGVVETANITVVDSITILSGVIDVSFPVPAKGNVPEPGCGGTGYTGTIEWTPAHDPFQANTAYTANVTLTAKPDYKFAPDATATFDGDPTANNVVSPDGKTLSFSYTFPATAGRTITDLTVTNPPSKTSYIDGEDFDPAGMVVKATYDDHTTDDNFVGYVIGYTTGTALKKGDTKVTLSAGSVTVDVSGLTVTGKTADENLFSFTDPALTYNAADQKSAVTSAVSAGGTDTSRGTVTYSFKKSGSAVAEVKDAGTYTLYASIAGGDEYNVASDIEIGSFSVVKAPLEIKAKDHTITYGDVESNIGVQFDGFKGADTVSDLIGSLSYIYNYVRWEDAGNYTITPFGVAAENYEITFVAGTLTVDLKALDNSMMATIPGYTYSNSEIKPTPEIKDGAKVLASGTDFTYSYSSNKDAGTATVTATGEGNYTGTASTSFTISPAGFTYSVGATENIKVGSGLSAITVATSSKTGIGVDGEAVTGALKWYRDSARTTAAVDADLSAKIVGNTVTLYWEFIANNPNYTAAPKTGSTVFTIVDGDPQVLAFDTGDTGKTYGDAAFTNAATNSSAGGGAITYASSDTSVATVDANGKVTILKAGTTDITATAAAVPGKFTETSIFYTLTVGKKTISVQANTFEITKVYDGTTNSGTDSGSIDVSGILSTDSGVSVTTGALPSYTDENVHDETLNVPLTITGDTNSNYVLESPTVAVPASITAKDLGATGPTVAITGTYTYTGSPITPTFTVKDGATDLAVTDYDTVLSDNVDAGTGTLKVTAKAEGNYTWSPAVEEPFTISKGTYGGLTAGAVATKYGETVTFDLDSLGFPAGYTVSSLVTAGSILDNSTLTGKVLEFELKNDPSLVGNTAGANVTIGNLDNYDNFTASITITMLDKSTQTNFKFPSAAVNKVYGDDDFTVVATGEEAGSSVAYVSDDTSVATVDSASGEVSIKKAGTAVITATASATADYASATDSYTLAVGKASITIQVMDKTVYVNSVAPDLSTPIAGTDYTVTGLVGADVLATVPTLNYASAPDMSTAGTVAITAIGAGVPLGGNYDSTITYIDGTLTIRAKSSSSGSAAQSYTLSFNTNGGSEIKSVSKVSGTEVDLFEYKPVREGYIFDGWYGDSELTKAVRLVDIDEDMTVYAKWKEEQNESHTFNDVKEGDWFYDAVRYVNENGLMTGTSESQFSPVEYTTRGMIVTILHRLENLPRADLDGLFQDVNPNGYYTEAIAWASDKKIVSGYSDGSFGPDDFITREQMAVILMNYAKFKGYDILAAADLSDFEDSGKISAWAADAVAWANAEKLIQGDGTRLTPTGNAQRCQIAAILQRFIETIAR